MAQTVLVVDDDPVQRRLLETVISRSGMAVVTAPGGQPALDLVKGPRGELLQKYAAEFKDLTGITVESEIIPEQQQRQKAVIELTSGKPSFDVWTGTSDKTVRKLNLSASIPVKGAASKQLGGLTSADVALSFAISELNQHQQIKAPANPQPYSVLRTQLNSLVGSIAKGISNGALTSTGTGPTSGSSLLGAADKKYGQCITAAKGHVTKMQACTKLLGSDG